MTRSAIVWTGRSQLDRRTPVVLVLTGLGRTSTNRKTGGMVQSYILRADMAPLDAVQTRQDGAICGGCVHRKQANGRRTCYVNIGQGPTSVYKAFQRGRYPTLSLEEATAALAGSFLRLGTYGDPAAVPAAVWQRLTGLVQGYTGYTHQWRSPRFAAFAGLCQASCETADDVAKAHALGFRGTFRVLPLGAEVPPTALHCPASEEAGKQVQCVDCRACDGSRDVVIVAHGPSKRFYQPSARALPVLA